MRNVDDDSVARMRQLNKRPFFCYGTFSLQTHGTQLDIPAVAISAARTYIDDLICRGQLV